MKLAAVGSNCVDFYNNIENGKAYPGGSPVNMAVYTVRLGGEASYTGPVGDDVYGKIMQEAIAAKGVDTSHLYVKPGKTAVSQVELLEGGTFDYDGIRAAIPCIISSGQCLIDLCSKGGKITYQISKGGKTIGSFSKQSSGVQGAVRLGVFACVAVWQT